tara:strand:- start:174 stop:965 length:792 start_codon:yes stop_codon:yes gene_type:complete
MVCIFGISDEECDDRCDREVRSYQEMDKVLREKINKLEDDKDELEKEHKIKLNELEEKHKLNLKENADKVMDDVKNNPDRKKRVCESLCGGPMNNKLKMDVSGGMVSINRLVSAENIKPPSKADVERYKFSKRLNACRSLKKFNQKKLCYKRIEGVKNKLFSKMIMGNTVPINLDLINNGITEKHVKHLKRCNSRTNSIMKSFCIGKLDKKPPIHIDYSNEIKQKYKHLFEGFENNSKNKEDINIHLLILILFIIIIILNFCD